MYTRQKYDARVDLWSCGGMLISFVTNNVCLVILYECLYGAPPFAADSVQGLIDQITSHESIKLPPTVVLSDSCVDLLKGKSNKSTSFCIILIIFIDYQVYLFEILTIDSVSMIFSLIHLSM